MDDSHKHRLRQLFKLLGVGSRGVSDPKGINAVAEACGLEPPNEYMLQERRGKTTRSLCEAVALASAGRRVGIKAHSHKYELQLVCQARAMAKQCGVDPKLIACAPPILEDAQRELIIDHHVFSTNSAPRRRVRMDVQVRAELEKKHGKVWDTDEMQRDFQPLQFAAPFIIVTRRSDNVRGTLLFQHQPRMYYGFVAEGGRYGK